MINADLIIGFSSLVICGVIFAFSRELSRLGGVFVNYTLIAIAFFSVVMLLKGFTKPEKIAFFESKIERNSVLAGIFIILLYLLLMSKIGFLPSSYIFYTCFNLYLAESERRWTTGNLAISLIVSLCIVTIFFYIFKYILSVPLPKGDWFYS